MKNQLTRYDALAKNVRKVGTRAKSAALKTAELMEGLIVGTLPALVQEAIGEIHYRNEEKTSRDEKSALYAAGMSRLSVTAECVGGAITAVIGAGGPVTFYGVSLFADGCARAYLRGDNKSLGSLPLEIPFDIVDATIGYCVDTIKTSKKMMRSELAEYTDCTGGGGILD